MESHKSVSIPEFLEREAVGLYFPLSPRYLEALVDQRAKLPYAIISGKAVYRSSDIRTFIDGLITEAATGAPPPPPPPQPGLPRRRGRPRKAAR